MKYTIAKKLLYITTIQSTEKTFTDLKSSDFSHFLMYTGDMTLSIAILSILALHMTENRAEIH